MLGMLWYNRPVRIQLLIAVGLINLLATVLAVAVSVLNTRTAIRVEIDASMELAQGFVEAALKELIAQRKVDRLGEELALRVGQVRHVRIMLLDAKGKLAVISPQAEEREEAAPPEWFTTLVRTKASDRAVRVVASRPTNPIVIVGEPADEIAEAWQELYSLALVWLALGVVVLGILYIVLGRILDPLPKLASGMVRLEDGQYATRLETPRMKELAVLANRFNMLAAALESAREENSNLYRRVITIQEEERRQIASDLHDEAGPCLFGITANAASIKPMTKAIPDPPASQIRHRADEILGICERLKSMNRDLLKKLRPSSRGEVDIAALIKELVVGFAGRHPGTEIAYVPGRLAKSYGEPLDLTLYRCVQEGITNAIRHGQAERVTVDLAEEPPLPASGGEGRRLRLTLRDDGRGIEPGRPRGFGLTVMNERVRAHGGSCIIESERHKGTSIRIDIPLMRAETTRAAQLVGGMT